MRTRTGRQREIFDFIVRFIDGHGYEPSYQMIARHFGLRSRAGIAKHVDALERQGVLRRRRVNGSFRLEIVERSGELGDLQAVEWLPADIFERDGVEFPPVSVPGHMLGGYPPENFLALSVPDEAMKTRGIFEDDIAIIEKRGHARDGDCVAVTFGGESAMLRMYFRDGPEIELRAENPDFAPIRVSPDAVTIHGVFRGLLRTLFQKH